MSNQQRNEELFFRPDPLPPIKSETPTPLKINKQNSGNSQASEPSTQWAQYRVPPSTTAAYGAPTSPPPTGPLPQPYQQDDAFKRRPTPADDSPASGPSGPRRQSMASSDASGRSGTGGGRTHFDANDPRRPTMAGYGHSPPPAAQKSRLADRRGKPTQTIVPPDSPGGPDPPPKSADDEEEGGTLFQIPPMRKPSVPTIVQDEHAYYPPPLNSTPSTATTQQPQAFLHVPDPAGINRLSSTASTSTTRASRGSPPPPETPATDVVPGGGLTGIEARYAASGIPGQNTLNEMQAQSAAAAARRAQYSNPQPRPPPINTQQARVSGRWSPTERPGRQPHGPPISFQGNEEVPSQFSQPAPPQTRQQPYYPSPNAARTNANDQLESGMDRLNMTEEPPPAYSPPTATSVHSQQYPNEKGRMAATSSPARSQASSTASGPKPTATDPNVRQHPAFAPSVHQPTPVQTPQSTGSSQTHEGLPHGMTPINTATANQSAYHQVTPQQATAGPATMAPGGPVSPPPLPEGWIAHLDNNSGQYYYIHLATQSTQWEFPKGPTPLNLQEPTSPIGGPNPINSPTGSLFKPSMTSPGFGPGMQNISFDRQSMMSMSNLASPTTSGFTGPPPSAGVDVYKVAPTNGVYFGPYLRYTNMDLERGLWLGSIMLVTDAAQPPTIHIHQSTDLSPNPRQLKAHPIFSHQRYLFYRYDVDLRMEEHQPAKWTYAVTSHLGCTRYEFLVASRYETSWRFVAHSGNDFALNISANDRAKLGGIPLMWKDVLLKHQECGGFHTQIGLGGQIYADRLWKDIPALKQWIQTSGKDNRKNAPWTPKLDEDVTHAYFHYYTSHFDQPCIREAFAQIPHVCCLDDHDIFDGYGSYPDYMHQSHMFQNIGRIGIDMYLLFQHHTTHEILRAVHHDLDLFSITGKGWHFIKYLGPAVVIVGPDTRSERTTTQVMAGPTYQGIFPKVAVLPPSVQHCIWLFPVPLIYPRLDAVEQMASTVATGKKMVTGGFNMLGKVAGGVAGVVGAKNVVNSGFDGLKKAVGKSGLMQGVLSPFGEVEVLDELRDMWTHESKDLERTYIIRTLQGISHNKTLRMTFLSGSVNACGAGLVHDPSHPNDHKTMYQLITASIVNGPVPAYVLKFLHNNKPLYVPANGHRSNTSSATPTDTKEDMMEIFAADVDRKPRDLRRLMARRNYLACVIYDPAFVQGAFAGGDGHSVPPTPSSFGSAKGEGRLSLAADFMVQVDSTFEPPMKYGPVIIPSLEYGR